MACNQKVSDIRSALRCRPQTPQWDLSSHVVRSCRAAPALGACQAFWSASPSCRSQAFTDCLARRRRGDRRAHATLRLCASEVQGEAVTSTKSGLLLPSSSDCPSVLGVLGTQTVVCREEKPSEGEVVAVGPGSVKENGMQVAPWAEAGMKILHGKYGVEEVTYNGEEHVLVRDEDVLLSYEGEPTLESIKMPRGKVLLKLLEKESQGGILLSKGAAKPDTTMGEVVAVGDDDLDRNGKPVPMDIAVGDFVRFRFGNEVKLDLGKSEFRSVSASECLAKWRKTRS
ncbi:unnamed protein product [Effrenium voratum]|nr:unnamed protein product [Effrenium voratum]